MNEAKRVLGWRIMFRVRMSRHREWGRVGLAESHLWQSLSGADLKLRALRATYDGVNEYKLVRIVAKPKAPKLCMLSRAPNGLEHCRLPHGHEGGVHVSVDNGCSVAWLTNGTRLVPESDPKLDKLKQATAVVKERSEFHRHSEVTLSNIGDWEGAAKARFALSECEVMAVLLGDLR